MRVPYAVIIYKFTEVDMAHKTLNLLSRGTSVLVQLLIRKERQGAKLTITSMNQLYTHPPTPPHTFIPLI